MAKPYYEVGRYACKVVNQALGESRTGNPQFVLRFQVLGLVDKSDPSRYIPAQQQYERTAYKSITEKTIDYFIEDLRTLGFSGSSFKDLDPNNPGFSDFRGMDVDMWCAHENDQQGEPREKWSVAKVGGELKVNPIEAKKVRELDNLFGKHLKGLAPAAVNVPVARPNPPANVEISDDDVPF